MHTYTASRGSGKTTLCINKAAQFVSQGSEVYLVSASKSQSDFVKKIAVKIVGKQMADKIHYLSASEIFDGKKLLGVDKRKSIRIIFDDLDNSLEILTGRIFGSRSSIELVTATSK